MEGAEKSACLRDIHLMSSFFPLLFYLLLDFRLCCLLIAFLRQYCHSASLWFFSSWSTGAAMPCPNHTVMALLQPLRCLEALLILCQRLEAKEAKRRPGWVVIHSFLTAHPSTLVAHWGQVCVSESCRRCGTVPVPARCRAASLWSDQLAQCDGQRRGPGAAPPLGFCLRSAVQLFPLRTSVLSRTHSTDSAGCSGA